MILHKTIDCHISHLIPVLCKQVYSAVEDTFLTDLLRNNEAVRVELNATNNKAIGNTIRDKQPDSGIRRSTIQKLKSDSLAKNRSQRIVEYDKVIKTFPSHAKLHADKALADWRVTKNLTRTVADLFNKVKDVAKSSKKEPIIHRGTSRRRHSRSQIRPRDVCGHESCHAQSDGNSNTDSFHSSNQWSL